MKKWRKPKGIRINPITARDALARENEKALIECARQTKAERAAVMRKLQNLISGIIGA